jgi:hypothetical protein
MLAASLSALQGTCRRFEMKMLAPKIALATAVALAALLATEAAYAQKHHAGQRYRAAPKPYDYPRYNPWGSRFTPEEQRIIDTITENDWRNGK